MLFIPENIADISRYYKNTFVKFRETGERLYYIRSVKADKITGQVADGTPFELLLDPEFPYEVDYVLPHKSFFQFEGAACLLQRIPAKQYQRGISEQNVTVSALTAKGNLCSISVNFPVLEAFINKPTFVGLAQALEEKEKTSIVLSPRMAYVPANRRIYADSVCIAQVQPKHKAVHMFQKLFLPEVSQLAKDSKMKVV